MENDVTFGFAFGVGCGLCIGYLFKVYRTSWVQNALYGLDNCTNWVRALGTILTCHYTMGIMSEGGGDHKMVLVVRNDLKMGKGKIAAQCSHASVMAFKKLQKSRPTILQEWEFNGQPKVVTKTEDEATLLALAQHARALNLAVSVVQDAGRTQIAPGSKTVLAVGPGPIELVDKVTGHLKLL